ncbi:MAG: PQQ-binding-like beta-propeller repeat protein, partial [Pseudomonadota bacterium]
MILSPRVRRVAALLALVPLLAACSFFGGEEKLEGERIRIRQNRDNPATASAAGLGFGNETGGPVAGGVALPPPQRIAQWPQKNGAPSRNSGHLAGPASLDRAWTSDIGTGSSDSGAITSAPIVAAGRVFTLDAAGEVRAFDAGSGDREWDVSIAPEGEGDDEGFGGGLAFDEGRIYASTGFGEVLALDANSGEILWRTRLGAPARAAPAVAGGLIVAVARDNSAFGVDADTGEIRWRAQGATSGAGFVAGASPAIEANGVVVPFGSG